MRIEDAGRITFQHDGRQFTVVTLKDLQGGWTSLAFDGDKETGRRSYITEEMIEDGRRKDPSADVLGHYVEHMRDRILGGDPPNETP